MAIRGNGKKKRSPSGPRPQGGRGTNQYMAQPRSSDFDAESDQVRARIISSVASLAHNSAAASKGDREMTHSIQAMEDALAEGNQEMAMYHEGVIRSRSSDFVGSAVSQSLHADHGKAHITDNDDRIRAEMGNPSMDAQGLSNTILAAKHARMKGEAATETEEVDMEQASRIDARISRFRSHHSREDVTELSQDIHQLSHRRLASVGF